MISSTPQRGLAGTRVFFGETEAFLTYAGWNQVNVLVPNGVEPGKTITVRADANGYKGDAQPLAIAPASPGIFTLDGSGRGTAVVVNQDGTFNSAGNAAAHGSVVTFFATGYGITDPPGVDGKHPTAPNFPRPVLPVTVLFGSQAAPKEDLYFTGVIYTGVLQVNVRVPDNAPAGAQVPLTLRLRCGDAVDCDSQPNVTLAVK
jgi:uncharacterized protein (TIGR03437 family)